MDRDKGHYGGIKNLHSKANMREKETTAAKEPCQRRGLDEDWGESSSVQVVLTD